MLKGMNSQGGQTRISGRHWMIGLLGVAGLAAVVAMDIRSGSLEWQAGPLNVSMDLQTERGVSIRFNRLKPALAPGFADAQTDKASRL
ncbi:MAG: hypothetical protein AAGJ32_10875 [Pseudomonadota bacterium]